MADLPSEPGTPYSGTRFHDVSQTFTQEVFQIAGWTLLVIGVQYAHSRVGGLALWILYLVLHLLLTLYTAVALTKLAWWIWPTMGPDKPRTKKTSIAAIALVVAALGVFQFTSEVHQRLMAEQTLASDSAAKPAGHGGSRPAPP